MSAAMVTAATTLSGFAATTLPNLLLAAFSWIIAETLAGCVAYAQAMYPIPIPVAPEVAEPVPTGIPPRKSLSKPSNLSLVAIHARDDFTNRAQPAAVPSRHGAGALVLVGRKQSTLSRWRAVLGILLTACYSGSRRTYQRRQAMAELRALDDRSLRDIGLFRYDIEYVVHHGARRE
jgi:uncharacterized protein YjiS (DUF1127 family)